jgi:hypothetical protein
MVDADGKPAGWRGYLGIGNVGYDATPAESTLERSRLVARHADPVEAVGCWHRTGAPLLSLLGVSQSQRLSSAGHLFARSGS